VSLRRRAVVVHRRTELDELLDRHGTRGQAEFFLRTRGRTLDDVQRRHDAVTAARASVAAAVPGDWAFAEVERSDLGRFLWAPEDVVVVVGQDGLVANVAKYLDDQLVIGVDPEPGANAGVLVRHDARAAARLLATPERVQVAPLTTVRAVLDDGQQLTALNEIFVGHPSHQSARYRVTAGSAAGERSETQSSSGLIIGTGTGATGWCASVAHDRGGRSLPGPTDARLTWFVREAWPSPTTGVTLTEGVLDDGDELRVVVASDELVVFGDGMESDRLIASWGQEVRVGVGPRRLRLAV
jgi:NAD kinase